MAILPIRITETGRQRLSTVLWFIHWMCAVCGLTIIVTGLYIKIRIEDKVNLVKGYDGNSLPLMLIIIGACTVVIDLAGGKLCQSIADLNRRQRLKSLLLPYLLLLVVLNICIFAAGCTSFAHRYHIHHSFHRGLTTAMEQYKSKGTAKSEIDQLQIDFECCGNNGYEDWFDMQWIANDYLDRSNEKIRSKMTDGQYLNDDVPYSCCKSRSGRPCIHHHVHDNDKHFNYDYRTGLTLNARGCKIALMDYFTARLNRIGLVVMLIFVLQSIIFLLLRYLQTSVKNAYDLGNPEKRTRGWLLEKIPFSKAITKAEKIDDNDDPDTVSCASDIESFDIDYQPEGLDWNDEVEPFYENIPQTQRGCPEFEELGGMQEIGELLKIHKKDKATKDKKSEKLDKESKSDKKSKSDKESKPDKKPQSDKKSTGSTKKSAASTKKSLGSTKKSPGSTKKSPGSTKKSRGSSKKSPGSTKKSPGSTKKSPGRSTKRSPGSTKARKTAGSRSTSSKGRSTGRPKTRMKNKNNNIEGNYLPSSESSDDSDCSQTPLLSPVHYQQKLLNDRKLAAATRWSRTCRMPESTYVNINDKFE